MAIPAEQLDLHIKLWNEGASLNEIAYQMQQVFGLHITDDAVKARGKKLCKQGRIEKRSRDWRKKRDNNDR